MSKETAMCRRPRLTNGKGDRSHYDQ